MKFTRHLPVIIQDDSVECGLACLGMIASFHGNKLGLERVRRKFPASMTGTTLDTLIQAAAYLGMSARAVRLDLEDVTHLKTPCILHWDLNHYVVLAKATRSEVLIHDPSKGRVKLRIHEVGHHFTGVAMELEPDERVVQGAAERPRRTPLLPFKVVGLKYSLALIAAFALLLELCALVIPLFIQAITDHIVPKRDISLLQVLGFGFLFVVLFQGVVNAMRGWAIAQLGQEFTYKWTSRLFAHLLSLPQSYFERRQLGEIATRFGSVGAIQSTLTSRLVEGLLDGAMAIITVSMMLTYSAKLAGLTLLLFAVYASVRLVTFSRIRNAEQELLAASAAQQTVFLEAVRGVQTIKLNNKTEVQCSRFTNKLVESSNRALLVQRTHVAFQSFGLLILEGHRILILFVGAGLVIQGKLTIGMLIAYLAYGSQFTTRAGSLIDYGVELGMLRLHRERISDIQDATPEVNVEPELDLEVNSYALDLVGIRFRHDGERTWLYDDLDLHVKEGEMVAIAGPSGSGKSTLARIMLGLIDPDSGTLSIGGRRLDEIGRRRLRELSAAVMQDEHIFVGTIAQNISFFDESMEMEEVMECAKAANIHREISALPMGYQTLVGGMGSVLSGGQRQRLMLARALYRKPNILILDEATSHLDVECERLVNASVSKLEITRIVFAHRPETLALADRVYDLVRGKLVQRRSCLDDDPGGPNSATALAHQC